MGAKEESRALWVLLEDLLLSCPVVGRFCGRVADPDQGESPAPPPEAGGEFPLLFVCYRLLTEYRAGVRT